MESGKEHIKKTLESFCFPYIHQGDNCTFNWNATYEQLIKDVNEGNLIGTFNMEDIKWKSFGNKVKHYVEFLKPYETIELERVVKKIQNTTNTLLVTV